MPLRQECLKARHGGIRGASCTEKALKSPREVAFFETAKNRVAEAKPCLMGLCDQSKINQHTISIQFFEANLGSPSQVCLQLKGFPRYSGLRQKSCGAACNLTCTLKAIRGKRASQ